MDLLGGPLHEKQAVITLPFCPSGMDVMVPKQIDMWGSAV